LAKRKKKVLLIDIDPQGNATSGLGIDKKDVTNSVYDVMIGDITIKEVLHKTKVDKLMVCPSNIQLAGAEVELVTMVSRENRLKEKIQEAKTMFDYILIDCPPSLGLITINSLTASDSLLVPIQAEYYALEGLSQLMNTVKLVQKYLNPSLEIEGVLLTMFDSRTNLSMQVYEEVKKHFSSKVYKTVIPRNVRLSEAPSFGLPIALYDPKSKGAECYRDLAKEIVNGIGRENSK
jgi:chromosome partitioning protein